jgi:hypothetical protein
MRIVDAKGNDITAMVERAATVGGIPILLLLGCMYGESGSLDQYAERWGSRSTEAKAAIAAGRWGDLQTIIDSGWADISFGRSQRIVKYHYTGNFQQSVQNCMAVREYVFTHPQQDLDEMAKKLAGNLKIARQNNLDHVDGSELLGACTVYNAGHWPKDAAEWAKYAPRIENYRKGLALAAVVLSTPSPSQPSGGDAIVTIEEKAVALGPEKLGNYGQPETGVYDIVPGLRLQVFWNCSLIEYTKPDGNTDVQVTVSAEATKAAIEAFQS